MGIFIDILGMDMARSSARPEMPASRNSEAQKRATNVSLNSSLLDEARELGINVSRACERGLAQQIAEERGKRWLADNRDAIAASNQYVERHGVPLARFRRF
jgi:antitoxin CcdA